VTRFLTVAAIVNGLVPVVLVWVNAVAGVPGEWVSVGFIHFVLAVFTGTAAGFRYSEGI